MGGGSGAGGGANSSSGGYQQGGGAGGGYTKTVKNISVTTNVGYSIVIGAGGAGKAGYKKNGVDGGMTSAFDQQAMGGLGGSSACNGGDGGSGGGVGAFGGGDGGGRPGGVDGADGESISSDSPYHGGKGQGTTTREFGEVEGKLYSSGGNGYMSKPDARFANSGDGGHGNGYGENVDGAGGSGIVIIRNAREVT